MSIFKGVATAIVTPFQSDGSVDFDVFATLIHEQLAGGVDGIVVTGTTGEASTMTDDEQLEVIEFCVRHVKGKVPVIAGVGSNDTRHGIELSRNASKLGVDALLEVTPYYNKTNQEGLYHHFAEIAAAVDTPMILYNVPGRTQVNLLPQTVARLAKIQTIVAIKDATGNLAQTLETRRLCGPDFDIYSGNDDVIVPTLAAGGIGVISVVSNLLPKETHDLVMAYLTGDLSKALELQLRMKPLIDALFCEANPIPVKRSLALLGHDSMHLRLPLYESSIETEQKLRVELMQIGLL